jgi:hypothetical protein
VPTAITTATSNFSPRDTFIVPSLCGPAPEPTSGRRVAIERTSIPPCRTRVRQGGSSPMAAYRLTGYVIHNTADLHCHLHMRLRVAPSARRPVGW